MWNERRFFHKRSEGSSKSVCWGDFPKGLRIKSDDGSDMKKVGAYSIPFFYDQQNLWDLGENHVLVEIKHQRVRDFLPSWEFANHICEELWQKNNRTSLIS